MADTASLVESKVFQGAAGLYGIPWRNHEEYVSWVSQYDPSKHPVRTGHPIVFEKPVRYLQECPRQMNVRATRYMFPSGLEYKKWGFDGTAHSGPKIDVDSPGFIKGVSSSVSAFPAIQQASIV